MSTLDPKKVFTPRVENYTKYRPGYPPEVIATLRVECGLAPGWRVADIGSGTGLLCKLFLDSGCAVSGVEPNAEMRAAAEQILAGCPGFTSLPGSAEATGLPDASVDLVTAGMAFHWFDIPRARAEFRRILKRPGWVALAWNRVLPGPDPFMQAYTALALEYSPGWTETQRRDQPGSPLDLPGFFGGPFKRAAFSTQQRFDWDGLRGRTLSIAHAPQPGHPDYEPLLSRLRGLFDRYQSDAQVTILYEMELYYGRIE